MRLLSALCALLVACGNLVRVDEGELGTSDDAIIGGTVDDADPEVFAVRATFNGYISSCTATLIGERTLLTAAHCIFPGCTIGDGCDVFATNVTYALKAKAADKIKVVDMRAYEGFDDATLAGDIGLYFLEHAPAKVTPKAWHRGGQAIVLSYDAREVGYGVTSSAGKDFGTKRWIPKQVASVTEDRVWFDDRDGTSTCFGDSGGPAFMTFADGVERVIGVTSYGDNKCKRYTADTRVEAFTGFVDYWLQVKELCLTDGACNSDCRDVVDPDCVALGGACVSAAVCPGKLCIADARHADTYCSQPCTGDNACGVKMICARDHTCQFPGAPPHGAPPPTGVTGTAQPPPATSTVSPPAPTGATGMAATVPPPPKPKAQSSAAPQASEPDDAEDEAPPAQQPRPKAGCQSTPAAWWLAAVALLLARRRVR